MNQPILDSRTKESLMEQMELLAQSYTPQWRYEPGDLRDPGAAIASLFGELFSQTIDRFNQLPGKYYTEFLNLLGVQPPTPTPAAGLVQFEAGAGTGPVSVPAGTEVFAAAAASIGALVTAYTTASRAELTRQMTRRHSTIFLNDDFTAMSLPPVFLLFAELVDKRHH